MNRVLQFLPLLVMLFVALQLPVASAEMASKNGPSICQRSNAALQAMTAAQVNFSYADGESLTVNVRLADDNQTRAAGFQRVCASTIAEKPILFVFAKPTQPSFHMNNVVAAIDIAFIDKRGQIDSIQAMQPYVLGSRDRPLYSPTKAVVMALEAHPGFYQENNIDKTVSVTWSKVED